MRVHSPVLALLLAAAAAVPAMAAGSGTVSFEFLEYRGPVAVGPPPNDPGTWFLAGQVAGIDMVSAAVNGNPNVAFTGGRQVDPAAPLGATQWFTANVALTGNSVDFVYRGFEGSPQFATLLNSISVQNGSFSGINVGDPFTLGRLTFRNGGWFGAGNDPADNLPSEFRFRITTSSADGPQFNQTVWGRIELTVNAPFPNDLATLAGQQAEADWVSVYQTDSSFSTDLRSLGALRVYDACCGPPGAGNVGSIDLNGVFGSLNLASLSNPGGSGFFTASTLPLPPVPPGGGGGPGGIPEPDAWALLIAGFGLTGAVARRRRRKASLAA
ncbi:PEPxxWA-CTERM sorting domain-containing protein [Sandarakinorhabdus cyanobacteriorum]|uniref:PEPxxWA-CTERM sorting domain-containing protein n=1 Tax=Sandarakinorhabdus cyanobacteriorum TaxID=1981098 RepID=UPI00105592F2|nr:PEPxxWA-CTERM sorting domain-containing protein [Sandarakinorhabdus cyanobacteriorum]